MSSNSASRVVLFTTPDSNDKHRSLSGKHSFAISIAIMLLAMLANSICEAHGEHSLDPAFENSRHGIPPEGKVNQDHVSPEQLFLFGLDVFCKISCFV